LSTNRLVEVDLKQANMWRGGGRGDRYAQGKKPLLIVRGEENTDDNHSTSNESSKHTGKEKTKG